MVKPLESCVLSGGAGQAIDENPNRLSPELLWGKRRWLFRLAGLRPQRFLHELKPTDSLESNRVSVRRCARFLLASSGLLTRAVLGYTLSMTNLELPGSDLVSKGIADLSSSLETVESLLVSQAAGALADLGHEIPTTFSDAESRLYRLLGQKLGSGAHSKYNAYRRQLASFLRAARCVQR